MIRISWMRVLRICRRLWLRVCPAVLVRDGAHPLRPEPCCFTPRLWPIDCLPEKSEFRVRRSERDSELNTAWSHCCCWNIPPTRLVPLFSISSVSLFVLLIQKRHFILIHPHLSEFFTKKHIVHTSIGILFVLIIHCHQVKMQWWPDVGIGLKLDAFTFNKPPLLSWAIFPQDGLSSNPQTLCTCVSISSVAWRPFCRPEPRRCTPILSMDEIRLILCWWGRQHFLFIERQSSMKEYLQAGQWITWPHPPFYQIMVDPNNFTCHCCERRTKGRIDSCFLNPQIRLIDHFKTILNLWSRKSVQLTWLFQFSTWWRLKDVCTQNYGSFFPNCFTTTHSETFKVFLIVFLRSHLIQF